MGLAVVAVAVLLVAFGAGAGGLLVKTALEHGREVGLAAKDEAARGQALRQGDLQVVDRNWHAPTIIIVLFVEVNLGDGYLELWVNNTGGHVFDANATEVLLDGVHLTGNVTQRLVGGRADTEVWAPGDQLYLRVSNLFTEPLRAWVVSDTGATGVG